jgi:FtsP/CotA-like multicopper oxidase with cupredoxin domain
VGSIQINGPASLNYDIDLGVFPITDWYYTPADTISAALNNGVGGGAPPPSDNVLFNGTNINPAGAGGSYYKVKLTAGKRHLLRLINPSVENTFTVTLVGHQFTVIATDFVPINSFTTSSLYLGVGQRYDVTIDASQPVGNYWFNVTYSNTGACGSSVNPHPAAIFSYVGAPTTNPTATGTVPGDSLCQDVYGFTPVVTRTAPIASFTPASENLPVNLVATANSVRWTVNGSAIDVAWDKPTLEYVLNGNTNYPVSENLIQIPTPNIVSF